VSVDDLGVLVTSSTQKLTPGRLRKSDQLARDTLKLICGLTDSSRFPWVQDRRKATSIEVERAVYATASLRASQVLATERRGYGRKVEARLADELEKRGFKRVAAPNGSRIEAPNQHPSPRTFYGECHLRARKTDLLIGLGDGRAVAVEAKDSASVLNSVKRVLNDTAAKARYWNQECGKTVVPVGLLSGVFGVDNLKSAQSDGLYLVWSHDLDGFVSWLDASQMTDERRG
jgi:XamI restriction endonuclease